VFSIPTDADHGGFFAVRVRAASTPSPAPPDASLVGAWVNESMIEVHRALGRADGDGDRPQLREPVRGEEVNLPHLAERATLVFGTVDGSSPLDVVAAGWLREGRALCAYGAGPRSADLEPEFLTLLAKLRLRPRRSHRWR
jgi:hypothetical protein